MNTFKKVGLTALAGSLVVTSAVAGEMSVAGSASIGLKNTSKSATGRSWTMGNQLTFSGSGELDNGMNVSLSFVLDQADDSTTGLANSPFDSHSVTISSDSLGTLVFSGEGGSSAQSAIDTTAAGDLWDNGSGFTTPRASEAGNNSMLYTLPTFVDDLTVKAGYSPGGAGGGSATSYHVGYSGVEGLSVDYAVGQTETIGSEEEHTTMKASYAYGSFTFAISNTENAYDLASSTDEEISSWKVSYTVSDDLSVSYGQETIDTEGQSVDEEAESISVSYTTGGVTLSATQYEFSGRGNSNTEANGTGDAERWSLSASFAF
ncbi:porin [Candidatus Pelagibacter sp.]|uniref:porin n=1 Tax=Candidatus Pelagibacter sp. TaxID=2024849 RepID=UPI003F83AEE6|tara:strand:- start:535 stop:1491 length:957 start_codon:yes stop_codon:yes gene_type:complete